MSQENPPTEATQVVQERTTSTATLERADFYAQRRAKVLQQMGERGGGVALFASAPEISRPRNAAWDYRQDSDLYYLTGCEEPEVLCLLTTAHPSEHFVLFVRAHDEEAERWTGSRLGVEGALAVLGADVAYPIEATSDLLPHYLREAATIYTPLDRDEVSNERLLCHVRRARSTARRGVASPTILADVRSLLDDLRLIKEPVEQSILRTAARITVESHLQAMQSTRPSQYEYEVQAVVEYAFKRHGGARVAYPTIVGSGPNATTLHYQANSRQMLDGELLLIDAATEYEYYVMDLTRTIPVNGRFTSEQRRLYTIVLKAHEAALAQVRPGNRLEDVHAAAVRVITEGLVGVGLLQGHVEDLIADRAYKPYFMHATSHWIGLDIRDCGDYIVNGRSRLLEPGMVFSVEPGLYLQGFQWDQLRAAPNANVGIRIEDTVLVTENGCEVLTKAAPTDPDEIEAIMATGTHS